MREDIKSNVIKGPWSLTDVLKRKAKTNQKNWAEQEKKAQDFVFAEELTEAICVRLIQALSDNKVDIQRYISSIYNLLTKVLKGCIMISKGYNNDLQEFIDKIMID